jgi:FixJ family two-component response regulator
MSDHSQTVFIVDDDPAVRDSIELLVESVGLNASAFESAQAFLARVDGHPAGCVIVDLLMPGMSGLELQAKLAEDRNPLPVIVLTGHGEVPDAVRAMKQGAIDFIQKPFGAQDLLDKIKQALAQDVTNRSAAAKESEIQSNLERLTKREREVLERVVDGNANKVIALDLGISERTVEIHRSRVMKKMGARSLAQLIDAIRPA